MDCTSLQKNLLQNLFHHFFLVKYYTMLLCYKYLIIGFPKKNKKKNLIIDYSSLKMADAL